MNEFIKECYQQLKNRNINPAGTFDSKGRWFSNNADLLNVREPSKAWPYSQMSACRTLKYVKKVASVFNCTSLEELKNKV